MLERVERGIVAGLCSYEAGAILTRKFPTITAVHRQHPAVGVTIVIALAWHFLTSRDPRLTPREGAPPWHLA